MLIVFEPRIYVKMYVFLGHASAFHIFYLVVLPNHCAVNPYQLAFLSARNLAREKSKIFKDAAYWITRGCILRHRNTPFGAHT